MSQREQSIERQTQHESISLPEGIEPEQLQAFEQLYRDRLYTALQNTGRLLTRMTTHGFRDSPSLHDGRDTNRDPATFKKPFDEIFAFPLERRFGGRTTLPSSSFFREHPTISRMFAVTTEAQGRGAKAGGILRYFRDDFRERIYLSATVEQERDSTDLREDIRQVSTELESLASSIDGQVTRETARLYADKQFQTLMDCCISDIASALNTDDQYLLERLPDLLRSYLRQHPKALALIIEQVSDYLNTSLFDRGPLPVATFFPPEYLVAFEEFINEQGGPGAKEKKSSIRLALIDESSGMNALKKYLGELPLEELTSFYGLPSRGFLESQVLPTSWAQRGAWVLHWSKSATIFTATAERLAFMASNEAPMVLASEPGIAEGLSTLQSLSRLRTAVNTATQHYNRLRSASLPGAAELPYFPNIFSYDSLATDINKLLLKNHSYDFSKKIENTKQEVEQFLVKIYQQVTEQKDAIEYGNSVPDDKVKLRESFLAAADDALRSIDEVHSTLSSAVNVLQEHIVSTGRGGDFTRAGMPPSLTGDAEIANPVALVLDPATDTPILGLDDIFDVYGLQLDSESTVGKRE